MHQRIVPAIDGVVAWTRGAVNFAKSLFPIVL